MCPWDSSIVEKQVGIDGGITLQQKVTVPRGGTAKFRLKIRNVGTVPITNIKIVDILPAPTDIGVVSCTGRGSLFNVDLNAPLVAPMGGSVAYSSLINPCRAADLCSNTNCPGCGVTTWTDPWTAARSFKINYGTFILTPNQILTDDFDVTVPLTAVKGQSACNSFGYCARRTNTNIYALAAEN